MSRKRRSVPFLAIAALGMAAALQSLSGCRRSLPHDLDARFESWFVNLSTRDHSALVRAGLSSRELDSVALAARPRRSEAGKLVRTLRDENGTDYALGVYCPVVPAPEEGYPLVVYLHGGIGAQHNTKGERAYEMLLPLADTMPLLLASPSANRQAPWWSDAGMGRVLQAVRFMALHYPVDPDRVVLAGVSDGATGVYAVANAACAPFAGFIAVSGFGGMLPAFGMPLVAGNLMQRPIYNVNAGRDRLYPLDRVNEFLDRLRDQGVEVLRKEYPDEEHGFDYRDREWEAMAGLLRRWRRPRRTGLAWTFISGVPNCPPGLAAWSISRRPATIRGHRQNGLLHLDADGLARAAVVVPDAAKEPYRVVTLGTERRIRVETSAESYLSLMQRSCNPRVADRRVVIVEM